jgi:hypothetical protein
MASAFAARPVLSTLGFGIPLVLAASVLAVVAERPEPAHAAALTINQRWSHNFGIAGKPVAGSSPMVATLDGGGPSVLIGDRAGYERAYHLRDGSTVPGWPASAGGTAIDSTASVLGSGSKAVLYVGVGNSANSKAGAYWALNANGTPRWSVHPLARPTVANGYVGVQSSLAIGVLQGSNDVISGAMGQEQYLMDPVSGAVRTGFPWFQADTNFSTPAVADLTNAGHDEIIEGGDSTDGIAFGFHYGNGGHIRILGRLGNHGAVSPAGGLICQYHTTQVVQSSPAVGPFLANNQTGIVVGTGTYYQGASDTNKLIAIDRNCNLKWKADLHAPTVSSPALANVRGDGHLYVVQGTRASPGSGRVYVLNGATGAAVWSTTIPGGVYGGITTADLTGAGYQDVIVPTPTGTYILDGRTGTQVAKIGAGIGVQSSALVTADPDGTIGITIAGYDGYNKGVIVHYSVAGSKGSRVNIAGAWPMFHHDQKLTGDATTPLIAP